ncbi:MAG: alpha/beta hydrolase [Chitinophagaceae bacterium]
MMRGLLLLVMIICLFQGKINAQKVDTVIINSAVMPKAGKAVVVLPKQYKKRQLRFPVVYLLHGYGGNYSNWIKLVPQIKELATAYNSIIVCPDGGISSWYLNSPIDSNSRYATYIGEEVPKFIDANYRTIAQKEARAITGLSMGGHGGLYLGIQFPEIFGACGSMSGGVDLRNSSRKYDLALRIGDSAIYPQNWYNFSVVHQVEKLKNKPVNMIIDCGVNDFFFSINQQLHQKLLDLGIPHDYIERPGEHNWTYWANAIHFQLVFFDNYFKKNLNKL